MSRSFRKGRHPQNLYRALRGTFCDHLSPIRNTGKVNRHLLQRLAQQRAWYNSPIWNNYQWGKRALHVYDNERQAYCEFMHRHRLWNEPQREQAFKREARRCEEQTARKRDIAERIADWLEEQEEIRAEYEREMERLAADLYDDRDWRW